MTASRIVASDEPGRRHGPRPVPATPLYNLVYCSRAAMPQDDAALDRIVASARRNNPALGITGLLVYGSGVFFQWLEGPREQVLQLMQTLRADPRHQDVVLLSEAEEVRERLFPDWDMELVDELDIRDVLLDALSDTDDDRHATMLRGMLSQFEKGSMSELGRA